jgi:Fur family transcriptional regulator, iron response regulator
VVELLRDRGIQPSAQRVAVARFVLSTDTHPSADQVWKKVRAEMPLLSRATVYNTLNLLVKNSLLRELVLTEGRVVFDPRVEPHHHFVDDETGQIYDVPWNAVQVSDPQGLDEFDVRAYEVVLRGRRRRPAP